MNSPYFFASIADEYARRGEHVEITRPNGERVLFCGTVPPPDVSTCAAEVESPVEREVPVEYAPGWWHKYLTAIAVVVAICGAFKGPWF